MVEERLFSLLEEGLEELDHAQEVEELRACRERYEAGEYFVSFIGQYSAGKSYLINNLLERDLLPQGRVETTPLLTYIRYGAEEEAHLYYFDGHVETVDLSQVRRIMQSADGDAWDLSEVEHMEVFLDVDLLRRGMILLDTPGINTLIERHERLLTRSLALSSGIVYVTSGALAAVDAEKLELFVHDGCSLSLVRTHCDQINEAEELFADVVANDQRILSELGIRDHLQDSFYISNLPDSPYFAGIAKIRAMLGGKGADVQASLAEDTAKRLHVMTERVRTALAEQESLLAAGQAERAAQIERRRNALDQEVERLGIKLKDRQARLKREVQDAQKRMHEEIQKTVERAAEQTAKRITAAGKEVQTNVQMQALIAHETQTVLRRTYDVINHHVDPLLKEINGDVSAADAALPMTDLPEAEHYAALVEEQDNEMDDLQRRLRSIQSNWAELEEQISHYDPQKLQEMQEELRVYEQDLVRVSEEYKELGPYVPQLVVVDPGDTHGQKIGKAVGNICDWAITALTFAVGGGAKAAATGAAKAGSIAAKAKTAAEAAGRLAAWKEKGIAVLNGYQKLRQHAQRSDAPAGMLERITLEYWGQQIGKNFDHPPRQVEDYAYKKEYQQNKARLEQELRRKKEAIYERQVELGVFRTELAKKQARIESLQVSAQEMQQEIARHEQQWRENARERARQEWKEAWAAYYRDHLKESLTQQVESYLCALPERLEAYQEGRFRPLTEQIAAKQQAYAELGDLSEGAAEEKLGRVRRILHELKTVCA